MPPLPVLETQNQTTIDIPRCLTPVNNQRLKLSNEILNVTTPKTNEWYRNTFQKEINTIEETFRPSAPHTISPKPYKQPINKKRANVHTKVNNAIQPKHSNKPGRKIPLKQEFRSYSNSWSKRE